MIQLIKLHDRKLAGWLSSYIERLDSGMAERALAICTSNRVWDYHQSRSSVGANIEGIQNIFYHVSIEWPAESALPDPHRDFKTSCSCDSKKQPCVHAAALAIYRILEEDRQTFMKGTRILGNDALDARFQANWSTFVKKSSDTPPAFQQVSGNKFSLRPDLQPLMENYSRQIMAHFRASLTGKNQN